MRQPPRPRGRLHAVVSPHLCAASMKAGASTLAVRTLSRSSRSTVSVSGQVGDHCVHLLSRAAAPHCFVLAFRRPQRLPLQDLMTNLAPSVSIIKKSLGLGWNPEGTWYPPSGSVGGCAPAGHRSAQSLVRPLGL